MENNTKPAYSGPGAGERPPAVYVEMMRLPEGVWLPRVVRINALIIELFDGITSDSLSTFLALRPLLYRDKGREGELTK